MNLSSVVTSTAHTISLSTSSTSTPWQLLYYSFSTDADTGRFIHTCPYAARSIAYFSIDLTPYTIPSASEPCLLFPVDLFALLIQI